jgi:hypothetical protein
LKQLFSILLLGIFAFNIFGYRIYFTIAEKNSSIAAENKIEKQQYANEDLVAYKFSAKQLPYYTNSKNYEVANGEVEVNGTIMTYVKKRIYNDSIEYVCLPNKAKTNLRTAREDFFKLVNDLQNSSKNSTPKKQTNTTAKPFSYDAVVFETKQTNLHNFFSQKNTYSFYVKDILPNPYYHSLKPPPNFMGC